MKFKTRFLPKIVDADATKLGDLLVVNDDDTARLVLVVEGQNDDQRGAVLAEWGTRTSRILPTSGHLIHLLDANHPFRLIDGELVVQPLNYGDGSGFVSQRYANGALAVFKNGEIGIRVLQGPGGDARVWSLSTGKILNTSLTKYWLSHWQLVWRDLDDEVTLCSFPTETVQPST
jgi:hypothetical protein